MASKMVRKEWIDGRPRLETAGRWRCKTSHSASDRLLGYGVLIHSIYHIGCTLWVQHIRISFSPSLIRVSSTTEEPLRVTFLMPIFFDLPCLTKHGLRPSGLILSRPVESRAG